jgi:MHS family proline/betaine transporter-like MFS transporter
MDEGHGRPARRYSFRNIAVVDRSKLQRTVGGTAVGNFMEWYDFGIFGFLATTIAMVFFPSGSGLALVATFGAFAVSFLVRPIGGFFFGPLADRIGRKRVLTITITMMAAGTVAIGLLPGFQPVSRRPASGRSCCSTRLGSCRGSPPAASMWTRWSS